MGLKCSLKMGYPYTFKTFSNLTTTFLKDFSNMVDIRNFNRGITLSGSRMSLTEQRNMKHTLDKDNLINWLVVIGFVAFALWISYSHFEFASRMEATRQAFTHSN